MSDQPERSVVPRVSVDWYRTLPWLYPIFRTLPLSWRVTWLLPALLGVWLVPIGSWLAETVFRPTVSVAGIDSLSSRSSGVGAVSSQSEPSSANNWLLLLGVAESEQASGWEGILKSGYTGAALRILKPIFQPSALSSLRDVAAQSFILVWNLLVWSFVGLWIARRSIVELGTRSSEGWGKTAQLVRTRWFSLILGVFSFALVILLILFSVLVLGLIAQAGTIGQQVAFGLMVPTLLLLLPLIRFLLTASLALPLTFGALAAEKRADGFEGFSRASAYAGQAPVPMLILIGVLQIISLAGGLLFQYVAQYGWRILSETFLFGSGAGGSWQPNLDLGFWWTGGTFLVGSLVQAFQYSFFFTGSAGLYLAMRNFVDHTDFDDIDWLEEAEAKPLPDLPKPPATGEPASS